MDIFESLENLEVSEACFDDIMKKVNETLEEISEMKKAREEYKRKGYFDSETDKKHIDKVYNAGFTLKDNGRGGKHVIEWERR